MISLVLESICCVAWEGGCSFSDLCWGEKPSCAFLWITFRVCNYSNYTVYHLVWFQARVPFSQIYLLPSKHTKWYTVNTVACACGFMLLNCSPLFHYLPFWNLRGIFLYPCFCNPPPFNARTKLWAPWTTMTTLFRRVSSASCFISLIIFNLYDH